MSGRCHPELVDEGAAAAVGGGEAEEGGATDGDLRGGGGGVQLRLHLGDRHEGHQREGRGSLATTHGRNPARATEKKIERKHDALELVMHAERFPFHAANANSNAAAYANAANSAAAAGTAGNAAIFATAFNSHK